MERGILSRAAEYLPAKTGKVFVVTTEDVWRHQGAALTKGLSGRPHEALFLPGGEAQKRLAPVEAMAEEMVRLGADRSSFGASRSGSRQIGNQKSSAFPPNASGASGTEKSALARC